MPIGAIDDDNPAIAHRLAELSQDAVATPYNEAHRQQLAECFSRCWAQFESACPAHAAVLAWVAEGGLPNAESAGLLGRTPGATREFVSQCRKRARLHLAEWYELACGPGGSH